MLNRILDCTYISVPLSIIVSEADEFSGKNLSELRKLGVKSQYYFIPEITFFLNVIHCLILYHLFLIAFTEFLK